LTPLIVKEMDEYADKLDVLMVVVFEHFEWCFKDSRGSFSESVFRSLVASFETTLMQTHKAKYPQFFIFVASQKNRTFMLNFIRLLIEYSVSESVSSLTRMTCLAYLASFMARASFVDAEVLCRTLAPLLDWIRNFLLSASNFQNDGTFTKPPFTKEYYATCQALCYILCFRTRDILNDPTGTGDQLLRGHKPTLHWMLSVHLETMKHCMEAIAFEFLRTAKNFNLVDRKILKTQWKIQEAHVFSEGANHDDNKTNTNEDVTPNKPAITRSRITHLGGFAQPGFGSRVARRRLPDYKQFENNMEAGGIGKGSNPLDSFFPFDPYLLRRSFKFVENSYLSWEMVSSDIDREFDTYDSDSDEDCSDDDSSKSENNAMCLSVSSDASPFSSSFPMQTSLNSSDSGNTSSLLASSLRQNL
jgi:RNA polymerase I-specific transcription initiation factor RRN3